jgi:hypothetical protein
MSHANVLAALQQFCPSVAGRPESGVSLVSRFARADRGLAELSRRMPGSVLNAQIGVIAENDLRIYQLTF